VLRLQATFFLLPTSCVRSILSPSQLGVLLTFEPANAGYIMDKFVLHNMQKALLHCLQKMNNSSADSLINKRFSNLFHVLPFLFLQTGSFDKNRLRERSEKFKNLIMEDKTDDILVGDVKKKTSTAHSMLKKNSIFKIVSIRRLIDRLKLMILARLWRHCRRKIY